jgi:predicted ATPase
MVTSIKIENFRCLRNVEVEMKNFNVLVGPNDSGKTSFLDAFKVLQNITHEPIENWVVRKDNNSNLSELLYHIWQQNSDTQISIRVEWEKETYYQVSFGIKSSRPTLDKELVVVKGREIPYNGSGGPMPNQSSINSQLLQHGSPIELRNINEILHNIKQHSFLAHRLRLPTPPRIIEDGLEADGFGLAGYMAALKLQEDDIFARILQDLHTAIPRIKTINAVHNVQRNCYEISFTNTDSGIKVPASACSDGVLLFLAYLTLLYSPCPPSILLIEEPENGVHPRRLKSIVHYLRKLSQTEVNGKTPQIILTTHSPYLLDYVEASEVLVFHRNQQDGATAIQRLSKIPDFKKKSSGFLLGEFWTAFGEEALVEGKWDDGQN